MGDRVTVDLITEDVASDEWVLYLVEDGPWPEPDSNWHACLQAIQDRILSAADAAIDAKRADYFLAGTLVVWDVDPIAETILCYRASAPTAPVLFARGETADAEPAVPGWRVAVDELFD